MWRDRAVWVIAVAVLGMVLFAGCGESEEPAETQSQAQRPSTSPTPGQAPTGMPPGASQQGPSARPMPPGMPGQRPGARGPQAQPSAREQPSEMGEAPAEPSGPSYQERYKQGELTEEELREERQLQEVERKLGYPVGPE